MKWVFALFSTFNTLLAVGEEVYAVSHLKIVFDLGNMSGLIRPGGQESDRFDRSKRIGWLDLDSIARTRCMVVGAGALGNEVVKNLVLSGFREITLVDMDSIELSNLNRCLFFREEDCKGRTMKAEVVARRASNLDPSVTITPRVEKIQEIEEEVWTEHQLVFGCLDNITARLHVNSHCYYHSIPYIDGGTHGFRGKVQVIIPELSTPCFQCGLNRSHFRVLEKRFSCTGADVTFYEPGLPAEITTTSVIGAIQVREGLKIASGREDMCINHILHYDGERGTSEIFEIDVDPDCPNHTLED